MSWVAGLHGFQMQWSSSPQRSQGLPFKQGLASLSDWLREGCYSQTLILGYAGIIATVSCAGYSSTLPSLEYRLVGGWWHSEGLPWRCSLLLSWSLCVYLRPFTMVWSLLVWANLVVVDLQPLLCGVAWVLSIQNSLMAWPLCALLCTTLASLLL